MLAQVPELVVLELVALVQLARAQLVVRVLALLPVLLWVALVPQPQLAQWLLLARLQLQPQAPPEPQAHAKIPQSKTAPQGAVFFSKLGWRFVAIIRLTAVLSATLVVVGCSTKQAPAWATLQSLISGDITSASPAYLRQPLNPAYSYMRAELEGRSEALMVLGYTDPHPNGPVEVWYSAQGEVIKLQNGRIIETTGLPMDARFTPRGSPAPTWDGVSPNGVSYSRERDEPLSYRFGMVESVHVSRAAPPAALLARFSAPASWFKETVLGNKPVPDSWFAFGNYRGAQIIVYSRQCLATDYCLQLQKWPAEGAAQ